MRGKGPYGKVVGPAVLCALIACGDGETLDGGCPDDPSTTLGPIGATALRSGFVSIADVLDRTLDESGVARQVHSGRVQAGFADLSTVTSTPARVMALGPSCFGLVSRPVRTGAATLLDVEEVRVEGTARGTVIASQVRVGTHVAAGEPLLGAGDSPLRFVATSTAVGGFAAFDQSLEGLRGTVDLEVPDPAAPADLTLDQYPIRWAPAGADWVEIFIEPEGNEVDDGGQVVCRVVDDGCFDLPAAVTAFLLSGNTDHYTLGVQLHRYGAFEPDAETFVEIEAIAETRLTIDNGVFE